MKRLIHYILLGMLTLVGMTSCENKRDTDPMAGMWQLTQWIDPAGCEVQRTDQIYYCLQLSLIQFNSFKPGASSGATSRKIAHYDHSGGELRILDCYDPEYGNDVDTDHPLPPGDYSALAPFGVPSDGRFDVLQLDSKKMVLRGLSGTLTFRKY